MLPQLTVLSDHRFTVICTILCLLWSSHTSTEKNPVLGIFLVGSTADPGGLYLWFIVPIVLQRLLDARAGGAKGVLGTGLHGGSTPLSSRVCVNWCSRKELWGKDPFFL